VGSRVVGVEGNAQKELEEREERRREKVKKGEERDSSFGFRFSVEK
jgi:hypothetical protein